MPSQDASNIKEKIISIIKIIGPSLPYEISSKINMSILFTSAFLSELLSEKRLKISNMKVGSSPIYFLPGQEPSLERFSIHLKSREKDAFELLKEKKILKDSEQEPAIRVALRAIKDFAIPIKESNELFWVFFTINNEEAISLIKPKEDKIEKKEEIEEIQKETIKVKKEIKKINPKVKKEILSKTKNISQKNNENLFNKVKEFLLKRKVEILDIENFNKEGIVLKIKENENEKLLIVYNKKKIGENEILKASKKASEKNMNYSILSFKEPSKKISNFINAIKKLDKIEVIE